MASLAFTAKFRMALSRRPLSARAESYPLHDLSEAQTLRVQGLAPPEGEKMLRQFRSPFGSIQDHLSHGAEEGVG
jgi:hypothetical protein